MIMKAIFALPDMGPGGAERVVSILCREFSLKGIETEIWMLFGNRIHYELPFDTIVKELNLLALPKIKRLSLLRKRLKKEKNITEDVSVLALHDSSLKYVEGASLGLNIRIISCERNNPYVKGTGVLSRIKAVFPYLCSSFSIFQTYDARKYYSIIPDKRCAVIPNPITPVSIRWNGDIDSMKLISVCRLHNQKNLPMTVDVIDILKNKYPDIHLDIYGEGPLENELKELIRKRKLDKNISLRGVTDNVVEKLANSSVYISTSDFEGISNSMLEAMSVGMPIVCTDCPIGGAALMLSDGAGLLSGVGDAESVARNVDSVLTNKDYAKELALRAYEKSQLYSPEKIAEQWLETMKRK